MLTRLMAGDRPVAWNYGFQFAGSWFWYQPTFDSEFEQSSPGICLLAKIIAEACERPDITRVDLGLGAEGYKDRFANGASETLHVTLTPFRSDHGKEVLRYRAAALIKANAGLERTTRFALAKLGASSAQLARNGFFKSIRAAAKRLRASAAGSEETVFYEWSRGCRFDKLTAPIVFSLKLLDLEQLAAAAMEYFDDEKALNYLLRCADRLKSSEYRGYALIRPNGTALAFAWVSLSPVCPLTALNYEAAGLAPNAAFLFDRWTSRSQPGQECDEKFAQLIADDLARTNRTLWMLVGSSSDDSLRKLAGSGFQRRYSILQRRLLFHQRAELRNAATAIGSVEVPVAS